MNRITRHMDYVKANLTIDRSNPLHEALLAAADAADNALSHYADGCERAVRDLASCLDEAKDSKSWGLRCHLPDFRRLTEMQVEAKAIRGVQVLFQLAKDEEDAKSAAIANTVTPTIEATAAAE